MSPEGTKRKLTAILGADVKGYSRLMEVDEEATVATLTTYWEVMAGNSSFAYKGKPVDVRKVGRELGVRYVLEGSVQNGVTLRPRRKTSRGLAACQRANDRNPPPCAGNR